jgi:acyl carrier protein
MNAEESQAAVFALLSEITPEADLASLDVEADLRTELDMDSMDFLNLVEGLAESTGVDIPEADYPKVRSVQALAGYLALRTGEQPAPAPLADARTAGDE